MKCLKKLTKAISVLFIFLLVATVNQVFAMRHIKYSKEHTEDIGVLAPILRTTSHSSFGQRKKLASVNPKTWSYDTSKYVIQVVHPTRVNVALGTSIYWSIYITRSSQRGACYSIFNEVTHDCMYKIYESADGEEYQMVSVGAISLETDFARMFKDDDNNWIIAPFSVECGRFMEECWWQKVSPRSHRPNANDIMRGTEIMSTVTTVNLDPSVKNVVFLLAGTILN